MSFLRLLLNYGVFKLLKTRFVNESDKLPLNKLGHFSVVAQQRVISLSSS